MPGTMLSPEEMWIFKEAREVGIDQALAGGSTEAEKPRTETQ